MYKTRDANLARDPINVKHKKLINVINGYFKCHKTLPYNNQRCEMSKMHDVNLIRDLINVK